MFATLILSGMLLSGAPAGAGTAAFQDEPPLKATLVPVQRYYQVGGPARVRLTLVNPGLDAVAIDHGVMFGRGLVLVPKDGIRIEVEAPPEALGKVLVAPKCELSFLFDLQHMAPKAFEKTGYVEVEFHCDASNNPWFELEVWKDYTGTQAVIETEYGDMLVEFFFDQAPITVRNFVDLADSGFYNGLTWHRIVKGFMIQGGCPRGDGKGNSGKNIPLEISDLVHTRGTLSMARSEHPDSASSQFFVIHQGSHFLDGNYSAFGRVVEGLDTLDKLADVECVRDPASDEVSRPKKRTLIKRVRILPPGESPADGEGGNAQ